MNTWLLVKPDLWGWHTELFLCQWAVQIFPVGSCFEIFESLLTIEKSKYWYTFMVCKKYWLTMNIPSQLCTDAVWFFNLSVVIYVRFCQGWDDPYVPRTHEGLLKWKYPEMNSVDFHFEVVYVLYLEFRNQFSSCGVNSPYGGDRWELVIDPFFFCLNVDRRS